MHRFSSALIKENHHLNDGSPFEASLEARWAGLFLNFFVQNRRRSAPSGAAAVIVPENSEITLTPSDPNIMISRRNAP